jgi:hypothetical protein
MFCVFYFEILSNKLDLFEATFFIVMQFIMAVQSFYEQAPYGVGAFFRDVLGEAGKNILIIPKLENQQVSIL